MLRRTYNGWGSSPLKQITTANVARLRPVWGYSTGEERGHEAPPLVNNGVFASAGAQVHFSADTAWIACAATSLPTSNSVIVSVYGYLVPK